MAQLASEPVPLVVGTAINLTGTIDSRLSIWVSPTPATSLNQDFYTGNGGTGNTGGGATANTHRPLATVGVIATYTGA